MFLLKTMMPKQSKKRLHIISAILAVECAFFLAGILGASDQKLQAQTLSDISSASYEGQSAIYLQTRGVISGFPDGTFRGGNFVNRVEAAKMLLLAGGFPLQQLQNNGRFPDIEPNAWYEQFALNAVSHGLMDGYPDGTFGPALTINRAEFLKMLLNAFGVESGSQYQYTDVAEDAWFARYVGAAEEYNLFLYDKAQLVPAANMSRSEVAWAIYQMLIHRQHNLVIRTPFDYASAHPARTPQVQHAAAPLPPQLSSQASSVEQSLIVTIVSSSSSSSQTSSTSSKKNCEDSDATDSFQNGMNFAVKGTIDLLIPERGRVTADDVCDAPTILNEYFCEPSGRLGSTLAECEFGCLDGACILETPTSSEATSQVSQSNISLLSAPSSASQQSQTSTSSSSTAACIADADCNDGNVCTQNVCSGGRCFVSGNICISSASSSSNVSIGCLNDSQCNDGDICTQDVCFAGRCFVGGNLCTASSTPPSSSSAQSSACIIDAQCNDGNVCTQDVCVNGRCFVGGNLCTSSTASSTGQSSSSGFCFIDSQCNDGNVCTENVCVNNRCFVSGNICTSSSVQPSSTASSAPQSSTPTQSSTTSVPQSSAVPSSQPTSSVASSQPVSSQPTSSAASSSSNSPPPQVHANLYVTQETVPQPQQLLGGTMGREAMRLRLRAEGDDVIVSRIDLANVFANQQSISYLTLQATDGSFAAYSAREYCGPMSLITGSPFCSLFQSDLIVREGNDVILTVTPIMKTDVQGAVSGERIELVLYPFGPADGAFPSIRARSGTNNTTLQYGDTNDVGQDEIFVGRDTPGRQDAIYGAMSDVVLSKIERIYNSSRLLDGRQLFTGEQVFAYFSVQAAANPNNAFGNNNVLIERLLYTVEANGVVMDPGAFVLINTWTSCQVVPTLETQEVENGITGTFNVVCENFNNYPTYIEIRSGQEEEFQLMGTVVEMENGVTLQARLGDYTTRREQRQSLASPIVWSDKDDANIIYHFWVDIEDDPIYGTLYAN